MGPRMWRLVGAIAIASLAGACAGGSAAPSSAPSSAASPGASAEARDWVRDIDVGGRTLSVACVGPTDTGRPTVIFESGLGGDRGVWADVMTSLMATDRGCSYDRAGLGLSQPAPKPRTTNDQVDDLHALLAAAGLTPPYVFVGHSSGGWNVMVYGGQLSGRRGGRGDGRRSPAGVQQAVRSSPPEGDRRRTRRTAPGASRRGLREGSEPEPRRARPDQERRPGRGESRVRRSPAGGPDRWRPRGGDRGPSGSRRQGPRHASG